MQRPRGSHCDAPEQGLTAQGRAFVRALYAHRMLPDVSHLSETAAWDVVRLGLGPVIASHANSRAVCAHTRNLSDDLFCAIRDSGGVVGLNLYTDFLGGEGMDAVVRHVEHLLDLGGDRTLALGGDLDGCDTLGGGITGVQDYPKLYAGSPKPAAMTPRYCRISSPTTGCACCRNNETYNAPPQKPAAGHFSLSGYLTRAV